MLKFYSVIFFIFFATLLIVNVVCFIPDFNTKQLTNPYFLGERTKAVYALAGAIIFETGVSLPKTDPLTIYDIVDNASMLYDIDNKTLLSLISLENEYRIAKNGGVGVIGLTYEQFYSTPYGNSETNDDIGDMGYDNPFCASSQIYATAYLIRGMVNSGMTMNDAIKNIILAGSSEEELSRAAPQVYEKYMRITGRYEI